MAIRMIKTCDVTGVELDDNLTPDRITWDGKTYDLYLSNEGKDKMDEFLAPILAGAAQAETGSKATSTRKSTAKRGDLAEIRAWAKDNGHEVSDRGRIKKDILDAYDAAQAK